MDAELVRYITEKCRKDRIAHNELLKIKLTPVGVKGGVPWAKLTPKHEIELQAHVTLRACMASRSKEAFLKVRHGILRMGNAHAWSVSRWFVSQEMGARYEELCLLNTYIKAALPFMMAG